MLFHFRKVGLTKKGVGVRAFESGSRKANSPQSGLFSNLFGKSPLVRD